MDLMDLFCLGLTTFTLLQESREKTLGLAKISTFYICFFLKEFISLHNIFSFLPLLNPNP